MFRLPISGLQVAFQQPSGWDDLLLQEQPGPSMALSLMLIERLAQTTDGGEVDWRGLTVTDLDTLLLLLRQKLLGDVILSDTRCEQPSCGARVDISFRIGAYLASHRRRSPHGVETDGEAGWFRLAGELAKFRLPTGGDLSALPDQCDATGELMRQCARPEGVSARIRRRMEHAMEALSPSVSRVIEGRCPECGAVLRIYFDVRSFVLAELRHRAASIYEEVHLLALHYKWPEESILGLPPKRRRYYAEMLRSQGSV